jgi:hypothetical protein
MLQRLVRVLEGPYYLFLGIWLGAIVLLAAGAGIVFRVVREHQPVLGQRPYDDPAVADQGANILAGAVVGDMIQALGLIASLCAMGAVACAGLQLALLRDRMGAAWANVLRTGGILFAVGLLGYHALAIVPDIEQHRTAMYDPVVTEQQRMTARAQFQPLHEASERVVTGQALCLLVAILVSPTALRRRTEIGDV